MKLIDICIQSDMEFRQVVTEVSYLLNLQIVGNLKVAVYFDDLCFIERKCSDNVINFLKHNINNFYI